MTHVIKRVFDIVASGLGLALLSPWLVVLALLVRRDVGSPILFRQARAGRDGQAFSMVKFRTMRTPGPGQSALEFDEVRLTSLGRWLRSSSLDELPTLWNVLRGDMSLVGPRPLLLDYLPRYTREQYRRHEVRPGVTGWAQVHGRNEVSWEKRFVLDVWYVDHHSLWLDLRILLLTVVKVLRREGISKEGHATMPEFRGPSNPDMVAPPEESPQPASCEPSEVGFAGLPRAHRASRGAVGNYVVR